MIKFKPIEYLFAAGIVAGLVGIYFLSTFLEPRQPNAYYSIDDDQLSLQGEKLKGFALGFEGLIADWYWMRSLQYIGNKLQKAGDRKIDLDNLKPLDPKLLYPLLENATTLDPNFVAVYSYGASVLPAIDQTQAIQIVKKGIENNPDEWLLYHQLGFIYWKLEEYENAASAYEEGANIKNAPAWMKSMSARMKQEGGSRETARQIYTQLYESSTDSKSKESARVRLLEIESMDERDLLNGVLAEFRNRNGRCISSWNEVIESLKTKQTVTGKELRANKNLEIVDPTGVPYLIDSQKCTAGIDYKNTGLPGK